MGFSRQEYWTGLPFPSPGDLPDPGIKPRSPSLQADSLLPESPGKPQLSLTCPGALFFHAHHQRNCLTEPYNCWSTLERHGCTRRLPLDSQTTSLQRARVREGFLHAAGCRAALPVVCVPRGQFCHLTVIPDSVSFLLFPACWNCTWMCMEFCLLLLSLWLITKWFLFNR